MLPVVLTGRRFPFTLNLILPLEIFCKTTFIRSSGAGSTERFEKPTPPQEGGWQSIAAGAIDPDRRAHRLG